MVSGGPYALAALSPVEDVFWGSWLVFTFRSSDQYLALTAVWTFDHAVHDFLTTIYDIQAFSNSVCDLVWSTVEVCGF